MVCEATTHNYLPDNYTHTLTHVISLHGTLTAFHRKEGFFILPLHCLIYAVSIVRSYCLKVLFRQDKHLLAIHWMWSDFRSTSPVGRARLPWCYTEVGIRAPCSKTVRFPCALLWAAGLGTTSMPLQGANYLSTFKRENCYSCSVLQSPSVCVCVCARARARVCVCVCV